MPSRVPARLALSTRHFHLASTCSFRLIANPFRVSIRSVHEIVYISCILDIAGEQSTVIVICEGEVQYEGSDIQAEMFSHHFIIKKVGDVWKVTNDTFRFTNFKF